MLPVSFFKAGNRDNTAHLATHYIFLVISLILNKKQNKTKKNRLNKLEAEFRFVCSYGFSIRVRSEEGEGIKER